MDGDSATRPATKTEQIAAEVARAIGAGKAVAVETVDFADPHRPKTCLEVDFPILPVNRVAQIEGNASKPVYQMSKWWARRRSSVFRSLLLAGAMKAPDDPALAAKAVWDAYYANHQKKGALKHLKVADIFMGGGTTLVEGSRLGMQMYGNDLNPVAWFVVKNEFTKVAEADIKALLDDIESEVRPEIAPFYACNGPDGEKGKWTRLSDGAVMGEDFDAISLHPEDRKNYKYEGPELIYTFWAKHGACQVTGCGHRTPIMTSPVIAVKSLSIKAWADRACPKCKRHFDLEPHAVRMAPDVPLILAETEEPYAVLELDNWVVCPHCQHRHQRQMLGKPKKKKKIEMTLLVHPAWFKGSPKAAADGSPYGGTAQDDAASTIRWNKARQSGRQLLEVRGALPERITCPISGTSFWTDEREGTVPKKSNFQCGHCGTVQDVLESTYPTSKTAPYHPLMFQGMSPVLRDSGSAYGGRFFSEYSDFRGLHAAEEEWERRKVTDLARYWPQEELPYGLEADFWSVRRHGYTHWYTMFNHRQLLGLSLLAKAIDKRRGRYPDEQIDLVIAAFQQYVRNQCMMTVWNLQADKLEPQFAKNNFRPKSMPVENSFFSTMGRGNWTSCCEGIFDTLKWSSDPWELLSTEGLDVDVSAKSLKLRTQDPLLRPVAIECCSATDWDGVEDSSLDMCITDPPFGDLMQYAEWSDFFYVWLRPLLSNRYEAQFSAPHTPRALEVVSNKARNPDDPNEFYRKALTSCWATAFRKLKAGGILAFTFHHHQDGPWIDVLESLFDAGFILEATFPVRGDETKGEGQYGSQKVEYDIIHVCRKRLEEPSRVSWAKMRREVLQDVRQLQQLLEHHRKEGLPPADLQVIRRGKALEYFSRHYGQVYVNDERPITVKEALVGINQLIDEEGGSKEPPPANAEPLTRQFLRIFEGKAEEKRDQVQKYLRGTGVAPDEYVELGWCERGDKVFRPVSPLDFAQRWHGRHRRNLVRDYDQAMVLIGACFENSGINAADTVKNDNFDPRPSLKGLLDWLSRRANTSQIRTAASRALAIYQGWEKANETKAKQLSFFEDL